MRAKGNILDRYREEQQTGQPSFFFSFFFVKVTADVSLPSSSPAVSHLCYIINAWMVIG